MESQRRLMDEFREAARRRLKRISVKERNRIIDNVRMYSFTDLLRQHTRTMAAIEGGGGSDSDDTAEMDDIQVLDKSFSIVTRMRLDSPKTPFP